MQRWTSGAFPMIMGLAIVLVLALIAVAIPTGDPTATTMPAPTLVLP